MSEDEEPVYVATSPASDLFGSGAEEIAEFIRVVCSNGSVWQAPAWTSGNFVYRDRERVVACSSVCMFQEQPAEVHRDEAPVAKDEPIKVEHRVPCAGEAEFDATIVIYVCDSPVKEDDKVCRVIARCYYV